MLATLVAILLCVALPQQLLIAPRYLLPALEVLLLVPLIAVNPLRLTRQTRLSRILSLTLVLLIGASNLGSLGILIHQLLSSHVEDGGQLLVIARAVSVLD